MKKKYQVFVSSTFTDLADERQETIRNILDLGHIPAGMELFPATDTEQLSYIKRIIDECDYYVLIMGGRYGSMDEQGVSFTEREYDYAVSTGKTVLAFPHSDITQLTVAKSEANPAAIESLKKFRAKVMNGRLVREWTSKDNLSNLVMKALVHAFNASPAIGWVRANVAASEDILSQINDLRSKNDILSEENQKLKVSPVIEIENLADIEELYTYKISIRESDIDGVSYRNDIEQKSWKEIFCIVGASITAPRQIGVIAEALAQNYRDRYNVDDTIDIPASVVATIERQLVALGLVQVTAQATEKLNEYTSVIMLTAAGAAALTKYLAVRTSATRSITSTSA